MKVYRYMSESELLNFQAGNYSELGSKYDKSLMKRVNTHSYKDGINYVHFFRNKEDISRIKKMKSSVLDIFYVCEFDIPLYILIPGFGHGFYDSKGYEVHLDAVDEFKVPAEKMKKKYLKTFTLDCDRISEIINFASFESFYCDDEDKKLVNEVEEKEFEN